MDHLMDIDDDDMEPTPIRLPHQDISTAHRVVSHIPDDVMMITTDEDQQQQQEASAPRRVSSVEASSSPSPRVTSAATTGTPTMEHLISDSDGAGDDDEEEDDDDFHSATSQDHETEFHMKPRPLDVIFGRGQPLRDHPGNMRMRDIIKRYTNEYRKANKQEKSQTIQQIQQAIAGNGTARFLVPCNNQEPSEGCKPATAAEIRGKISHGLRDAIKVEDLLDSEFVQLWAANDQQPPTVPPAPRPMSPDISPLPFHPISSNPGSPPPPLSLGPPPPLMMMPPQQTLGMQMPSQQMLGMHNMNIMNGMNNMNNMNAMNHMNAMNSMNMSMNMNMSAAGTASPQFSSYSSPHHERNPSSPQFSSYSSPHHQRNPSFLSQSGRSSMGPAIFHISVPQGGANAHLPGDEKGGAAVADDDLTLETAEKGLSSNSGGTGNGVNPPQHASAIAVNAVLAGQHDGTCWSKHYRAILSLAIGIIFVLVVLVAVSYGRGADGASSNLPSAPTTAPTLNGGEGGVRSSTLEQIVSKGYLTCGVANQPGYSSRNSTTNVVEGFEVDLCRAVAAGIFGREQFNTQNHNDEPVKYVFVETKQRFPTLAKGDVDVLFAITTHTLERQLFEPTTKRGFTFSVPYLHNGLTFAGRSDFVPCADSLNVTSGGCENTKICVLDGTTHREVVEGILPDATIVVAPTYDAFRQIYVDGGCNVLAGEQVDLFFVDQTESSLGDYVFGSNIHSKEPIALVTRDDDLQFSSFCNWIVQSLFSAEEVRSSGSSTSLSDLPTPYFFGERFEFMFQDAFAVVGDYNSIYNRHLERYVARSPANQINMGDTANMYATPFGNLKPQFVPNVSGGTLESIRNRGHLRCGITQAAIFAEFNDGEWSGMDISFCEALSAAIFDGSVHVRYNVLDPLDRFEALDDGRVDVLARVTTYTMERDVLEPTTGKGFTFSPPNFHDEIHFAGVPPFHLCADNLDTQTAECQNLLVCVTQGTTQSQRLKEVMASDHVLELSDTSETIERFVQGDCNAIAAGFVETNPNNIAGLGYSGEYDIGPTAYSRESLALVTREDDVVWSNMVASVVTATKYAEENNITSATFQQMPRVDLFQPLVNDDLFRNVIRAVGSYAEIWERAATPRGLDRKGRNLLNTLPLGPQLVSDLLWDKPSQN